MCVWSGYGCLWNEHFLGMFQICHVRLSQVMITYTCCAFGHIPDPSIGNALAQGKGTFNITPIYQPKKKKKVIMVMTCPLMCLRFES